MKTGEIVIRFTFSLAILVLGVALLVKSSGTIPEDAKAAGGNITTTWQATGFINVAVTNSGGIQLGPVTIGVSKWHNETERDGVLIYTEDWTADIPASGGNIRYYGDGNVSSIEVPNDYSIERLRSNWLYGGNRVGIDAGNIPGLTQDRNIIISFVSSRTPEQQQAVGRAHFRGIGNNLSCEGDFCLTGLGVYGYMAIRKVGDGIGERPHVFGSMIPTSWTVTGTLR